MEDNPYFINIHPFDKVAEIKNCLVKLNLFEIDRQSFSIQSQMVSQPLINKPNEDNSYLYCKKPTSHPFDKKLVIIDYKVKIGLFEPVGLDSQVQNQNKITDQAFVNKLKEDNPYFTKANSCPFNQVVDIVDCTAELNLFGFVGQGSYHQSIKIHQFFKLLLKFKKNYCLSNQFKIVKLLVKVFVIDDFMFNQLNFIGLKNHLLKVNQEIFFKFIVHLVRIYRWQQLQQQNFELYLYYFMLEINFIQGFFIKNC